MELAKVLEILSKHIIKLEEENQLKDWELERIRKENSQLKDYMENNNETINKRI